METETRTRKTYDKPTQGKVPHPYDVDWRLLDRFMREGKVILTGRQRQVMALRARGHSVVDIGDILKIERTQVHQCLRDSASRYLHALEAEFLAQTEGDSLGQSEDAEFV